VAAGKAATAMAGAARRALGGRIVEGLVVAPEAPCVAPPLMGFAAGHPTPTPESEAAGRRALALADATATHPDEQLLVLLSGGASALMAVPADGLTLDDKRETTARLLRAGADIGALNTVRKHLSAIKGGWLAARAGVCRTLAISDVVGDDSSVIASGPTVADTSTYEQALAVLVTYGGVSQYSPAVVAHLRAGAAGRIAETPKPGDARLDRATISLAGGRRDAMTGARLEAERRGYHVSVVDDPVVGEARRTAVAHVRAMLARARSLPRPLCIVSSGETTVRVVGGGRGGRNQELALAAAGVLAQAGAAAVFGSVGTDGVDGPTDAAGGVADSTTVARAHAAGVDLRRCLDDNNAYAALDALGDLIRTGPTGTNVGDLQVLLLS
jgi:hydroxypyruvate reductase